jgi:hypothetical protein
MRLTNHNNFAAQLHLLYFFEPCATMPYLPGARVPYYRCSPLVSSDSRYRLTKPRHVPCLIRGLCGEL